MRRIDSHCLTSYLELALSCASSSTIAALRDSDARKRCLATVDLAEILAERLVANMPIVELAEEIPLPLSVGAASM